jgi:hypothetical protein
MIFVDLNFAYKYDRREYKMSDFFFNIYHLFKLFYHDIYNDPYIFLNNYFSVKFIILK